MTYGGNYQLRDTTLGQQQFGLGAKPYRGLLMHGSFRLHIKAGSGWTVIPEFALSMYYETGDYYLFREQYNRKYGGKPKHLNASICLPISLCYRSNEHTHLAATLTGGFPMDIAFMKFTSLGSVALTHQRLTAWVRADMRVDVFQPPVFTDRVIGTGLHYALGK